ncbi:MAG: hypothetical protein NTZ86_02995, partial [Legionellales bacterium]|nr:hypothetical protein [Legionellales bacterium]
SIARTKQLLEERALEFKQKLQDCLSSFGSSQKEALPHLKRIQTLYRASNTAANESLDQKTRALQEAAQQKRERATLEAQQIFSDIEASHDRILEMTREWQRRNEMNRDAETLISRDEIEYFLEETLDGLDAEKTNIIQLKERLEAELPLSDLPVSEQTKALKTAKLIVKIIEAQIIIIQTQLDTLRRNRLKQDLTELSVKAMGADRFGEAKNETQITDVIEELYHLQSLQERMESPTSVDNPDLESIARTKQLLEERALEFNQKLQDCLSSFGSSQKEALPHLKRIQTLYRASNTAANETLDQKSQSLQVNMGRKKMAGASRSATKTRTVETDQLARKTTQERGTLDRPNINVEMEELARLQQDLVELSTGAMGAKNKEQILHLVQTLSVIQQMREALEAGHGKEILGSLTKQRAEELAREFKQELQSCLSSFSPSSQKAASKHLRQIQALYDSSTIALEEMIDKHAQSLQVDVKQRRTARVRVPERADLNTRKVDSNAEDRKDLQRIVVGFNMPPEFAAEINAGTESTPGEHLRFSARPGAHYELTALKTALDETGIFYEEKAKGVGNAERMLIIRQMPLLRPGFEAQFKQHYVAALKKIAAEAKAIRASQARSPQQLEHEEAARKISRDIQ